MMWLQFWSYLVVLDPKWMFTGWVDYLLTIELTKEADASVNDFLLKFAHFVRELCLVLGGTTTLTSNIEVNALSPTDFVRELCQITPSPLMRGFAAT